MEPRKYVPDVQEIANQLIADYRSSRGAVEGLGVDGITDEGDLDALETMASWIDLTNERGDGFSEDDWIALVQELARRLVYAEREHQELN